MGNQSDNLGPFNGEDNISFEDAMELLEKNVQDNEDDGELIWAEALYEEGTSGPLKQASGVLVDSEAGVTLINPDTGDATIIGDRFLVRVDLMTIEAEESADDKDDDAKDQADTSADRFRA